MQTESSFDFRCPDCSQELSAPPELFGLSLECPSCHATLVVPSPENARSATFPPQAEAVLQETQPSSVPPPLLWNPGAAAFWSLFLTPAFGSFLLAKNAETLGRDKEVGQFKIWMCITVGLLVVLFVTGFNFGFGGLIFFLIWYFVAARPHEQFVTSTFGKNYSHASWGVPLAVAVGGIVGFAVLSGKLSGILPSVGAIAQPAGQSDANVIPLSIPKLLGGTGEPSAKGIFEKSGDEALEETRKFLMGTWTYCGVSEGSDFGWHKIVIEAAGTMQSYVAPPNADDWGDPRTDLWEAATDKYTNTGQRYYMLKVVGKPFYRIIVDRDGSVLLRIADEALPLKRGDAFPFSK